MTKPLEASDSQPLKGGPSFSFGNRAQRLVWNIIWPIFGRIAPPPFGFGWRRVLLRLFGAKIGQECRIYPSARIWLPRNLSMGSGATLGPGAECYNMALISIGKGAIVSQRAFLCAGDHDIRSPDFQLVTKPISIGAGCWIAAEAYVGPGVVLGENTVLAARGCAVSDVPDAEVWAGNPARFVSKRS